MAVFTVRQGRRYKATISLGMLESFAGNEIIAERLQEAGFVEVSVAGSGGMREAEALWPNSDASAELPTQITDVTEIDVT
jgi:hypothetical protein